MKNKKIFLLRIFIIILIIEWMHIVFGFSAQDSDKSSGLSMKVAAFFSKDYEVQKCIEPIIRKLAHFSEYALGGWLFFSFFSTFKLNENKKIAFSILVGTIYASTDEIHQVFVPGRTGRIIDVWIDSLGVATGVFTLCLIFYVVKYIYVKIGKKESVDKQ